MALKIYKEGKQNNLTTRFVGNKKKQNETCTVSIKNTKKMRKMRETYIINKISRQKCSCSLMLRCHALKLAYLLNKCSCINSDKKVFVLNTS